MSPEILTAGGTLLAGIVASTVTAYYKNDTTIKQRLSVVETQSKNDGDRLERVEGKVDRVLEIVSK